MAGGGGFAGSAVDGASNGGHPQGTEYTLQGRCCCGIEGVDLFMLMGLFLLYRCDAFPPDGMAPTRARPQRLGN